MSLRRWAKDENKSDIKGAYKRKITKEDSWEINVAFLRSDMVISAGQCGPLVFLGVSMSLLCSGVSALSCRSVIHPHMKIEGTLKGSTVRYFNNSSCIIQINIFDFNISEHWPFFLLILFFLYQFTLSSNFLWHYFTIWNNVK